jgi:hypothetical protein
VSHTKTLLLWGILFATIVSTALDGRVQAQAPVGPSDSLCTYDRCAIWLDVPGLVQGAEARLLARYRWFSPIPLRRFVRGDSAIHYATRYEHDARRGMTLSVVGGLAVASGLLLALSHDCGFGSSRCEISNRAAVTATTLMFGGITIDVFGERSTNRARRAQARALWWHNRQFVR